MANINKFVGLVSCIKIEAGEAYYQDLVEWANLKELTPIEDFGNFRIYFYQGKEIQLIHYSYFDNRNIYKEVYHNTGFLSRSKLPILHFPEHCISWDSFEFRNKEDDIVSILVQIADLPKSSWESYINFMEELPLPLIYTDEEE